VQQGEPLCWFPTDPGFCKRGGGGNLRRRGNTTKGRDRPGRIRPILESPNTRSPTPMRPRGVAVAIGKGRSRNWGGKDTPDEPGCTANGSLLLRRQHVRLRKKASKRTGRDQAAQRNPRPFSKNAIIVYPGKMRKVQGADEMRPPCLFCCKPTQISRKARRRNQELPIMRLAVPPSAWDGGLKK